MKLYSGAMWVLWCTTIMVVIMLSLSLVKNNEVKKQLQLEAFPTVTFDLINDGLPGYPKFLANLREALEAPSRVCGLPTTRGNPSKNQAYVYVELKSSDTQWVTLGIDVMDLYVVGYQDNFKYNKGKKYRSTFFKDTSKAARASLFPDATATRDSNFKSTYGDLEDQADVKRVDLRLKLKLLEDAIGQIYGEEKPNGQKEAYFVLVAIQIVSEAVRFKFIENALVEMETSSKAFRDKMVDFQNDWSKISKAIHISEATKPICTTLPDLKIGNVVYHRFDEIKDDMGFIKFKGDDKQATSLSDEHVEDDYGIADDDQKLHLDEL